MTAHAKDAVHGSGPAGPLPAQRRPDGAGSETIMAALQRSAGNGAVAVGLQRMPRPGAGRCACGGEAGPDGECAACRARRLAGLSVQRAPLPAAPAVSAAAPPGWLVEDGTENLAPGQMQKSEWLAQLQAAICARAEQELASTRQTTDGCPILGFWIGYFSGRAASEVSTAAVRYAPEIGGISNAADAIAPIVERVGAAVAVWVKSGAITGIPEGAAADLGSVGAGAMGGAGVQRKGRNGAGAPASGGSEPGGRVGAILGRLGAGRPLDAGVRSRMEPLFGHDFSGVRVHQESQASSLAVGLDARAFTIGQHIALGPSEYQPGSIVGDALLAHELAHVVQQAGAARGAAPLRDGSPAYQAFEQDADTAAAGAVASLWGGTKAAVAAGLAGAVPRLRGGLGVQRCTRTVYHCPKGMSWKQLVGRSVGGGPICFCAWKCLRGEEGGYVAPSGERLMAYECPSDMNCETGKPIEYKEIPGDKIVKGEDGVTRDYSGDIKLSPGAHFTPLTDTAMCGCLPLDVEGSPTGTERTYTPLPEPSALELTDVVPGRAAKAMESLGGTRGGAGEEPVTPRRARMVQEPPPGSSPTAKVAPESPTAPKGGVLTPEPPSPVKPAAKPATTPEPPPKPASEQAPTTTPPPATSPTAAGGPTAAQYTIRLDSIRRPTSLTDATLDAHMSRLRANQDQLWARLEPVRQSGAPGGTIDMGRLNVLKGNIGEILARPLETARLTEVQRDRPGARLEQNVSIQLPDATGRLGNQRKLFTDGMIAAEAGGNLYVSDVFEIKAGKKGGSEATGQVFEWTEGKLVDGAVVNLENGRSYRYAPDEQGPGRIIGLARAQRHLIATKGAEQLGSRSSEQLGRQPTRTALAVTAAELDYLARQALETLTGPPPPSPAGPTSFPGVGAGSGSDRP